MGQFFKIVWNFGQNWLKFKKIWKKKRVILVKIWPKIRLIGIWMIHFSLESWYLYGSNFKFPAVYPPHDSNKDWF